MMVPAGLKQARAERALHGDKGRQTDATQIPTLLLLWSAPSGRAQPLDPSVNNRPSGGRPLHFVRVILRSDPQGRDEGSPHVAGHEKASVFDIAPVSW